jgi:transposase-like protein
MGNSFYADETLIDCGGRDDRFWCCIDWDTRLITGVHYSLSGNPIEAQKFLFKSIQKGKPKFIQTDGGVFYPKAFRKLFYSNKIGGLTVEHKIQNASVNKDFKELFCHSCSIRINNSCLAKIINQASY